MFNYNIFIPLKITNTQYAPINVKTKIKTKKNKFCQTILMNKLEWLRIHRIAFRLKQKN